MMEKIKAVYFALDTFLSELKQFYPMSTRAVKTIIVQHGNTLCISIDEKVFVYTDVEHDRFTINAIMLGGVNMRIASNLDKSVAQPLLVSMLAPSDRLEQFEPTTFDLGGDAQKVINKLLGC